MPAQDLNQYHTGQRDAGIIIVAHGSRDPHALQDVYALADATAALTGTRCEAAVLDFAGPSLADAARVLAAAGYHEAAVVPLLFSPGFHARVDVPAQLELARESTGMDLRLCPSLGCGRDIAQLLASRVQNPTAHLVLWAVGSARPEANIAVYKLAVLLHDLTGQETSVAFATQAADTAPGVNPGAEVLPLFVAHGRLLPEGLSPLGAQLAPIVADRAGVNARPVHRVPAGVAS